MPEQPHDARTRHHLALIAAASAFGSPFVVVVGALLGAIRSSEVEPLLRGVWVFVGPLAGVVFGYYFGVAAKETVSSSRSSDPAVEPHVGPRDST